MIEYRTGDIDRPAAILALLARCFPEYWGHHASRGVFPHHEIALLAEEDGVLAGHVGIMPFEVWLADGSVALLGGVASVAVAPEFRGRGIAQELCLRAIDYGREHGMKLIPLYTSLYRVYEKCGWRCYDNFPGAVLAVEGRGDATLRRASELSAGEREFIAATYREGWCFPGKVCRDDARLFHSWRRIFADDGYCLYLDGGGYALRYEEALLEVYTRPGGDCGNLLRSVAGGGMISAWLPPGHPGWRYGRRCEGAAVFDAMHGESPMVAGGAPDEGFYFPIADKF